MKVHIKGGFDRERCLKCNKAIKPGQQYTLVMTYPSHLQDLKMSYKYRAKHYPNCENIGMWEKGLVKDRIGWKSK